MMLVQEMVQLGAKRAYIRELFEYGLRKKAEIGAENVFDFSIGNPSVPAPDEVQEAYKRIAATENTVKVHGYTSATGAMSVREAIAKNLDERFGCGARGQNIFVTCGAAPALMATMKAMCVPGAEYIVLAPYFPEYLTFIHAVGGTSVIVPPNTADFDLHVDEIEPYFTEHTQAIVINSPNNPTGVVYRKESLQALAALLRRMGEKFGHPIYVIADEPYRELVFDGVTVPFIPNLYENTVVCYSWSKSLSLPGERIGYVYVPDACADSVDLFNAVAGSARALGHICAPATSQYIVEQCCGVMPNIKAYDENRKTLYQGLTELGYTCIYPRGAFYMFIKAPFGTAMEFSEKAKELNILIPPGESFGCPGYLRLSTCVSHEMIVKSLSAFKTLIEQGC